MRTGIIAFVLTISSVTMAASLDNIFLMYVLAVVGSIITVLLLAVSKVLKTNYTKQGERR